MKKYFFALASALLLLATLAHAEALDLRVYEGSIGNRITTHEYTPGQIVFRYKNDTERFRIMKVPDVAQAILALQNNPHIEYVEPNYIATTYTVPNDPMYQPYQWHFDNSVHGGVGAEEAWDISIGAGTIVAVVDTGIAYENYTSGTRGQKKTYYQAPDLTGTCFVAGYDFINNDAHPNDDNAHGTHVAGTIAQTTNNSAGVAGLAHGTCLMPVKVLGADGSGSYTAVANGIYFAADNGADVINMSLGGPSDSSALRDAVAYAHARGVTVVAASGNDNGAVGYPASYDDYVIAVGGTRFDEARAPYSNFGTSLDLVAPGGDTSVDQNGDGYGDGVLQQTFNPSTRNVSDFGYYFFQGTSMATPHVAAAAAMVIANGFATTPADVRAALESTARDLGDGGFDQYYGYGIIDIPAALAWRAAPLDAKPTVSITAPLSGALVSSVVNITANASDDVGVSTVTFAVGGVVIGTDTNGADGWSAAWDTTLGNDGGVLVSATALDTIGQETVATVTVTVDNVNDAPVAAAGADQIALVGTTVSFDGSGSSDDRSIVLYEWNFGDGAVATGTAVSHTYSATGTYVATLTVTDTDGAIDTDTAIITVSEPTLEPFVMGAVGYKVKGLMKANLSWSGAATTNVDVHRNGSLVATTANDGTHTDNIGTKGSGTFVYKLCEEGTNTCSNESVVTF